MGNRPAAAIAHGAAALPLVAHLVEQLEPAAASLLELVDHAPAGRYRHVVLCLGGHSAAHARLRERGVEVVDLKRRTGPGFYLDLYRALRLLAPDLLHTRSAACLDGQLVAALAGVGCRVHGEYGRDCGQAAGPARPKAAAGLKLRLLRRALCPLVKHYIAGGAEQERWLVERIGAAPSRVTRIPAGSTACITIRAWARTPPWAPPVSCATRSSSSAALAAWTKPAGTRPWSTPSCA